VKGREKGLEKDFCDLQPGIKKKPSSPHHFITSSLLTSNKQLATNFTMNRINKLFEEKRNNLLSIYFTAGHPQLDSTVEILEELQSAGVDMVEIGMPFSDPLADGPVIQESSQKALKNGMSLQILFRQLADIRKSVSIPLLLMGYLNPVMHFGFENFCKHCSDAGIDGIILPDLPLEEYLGHYRRFIDENGLHFIFLITPQTSTERLRLIDSVSNGFIYMVSSSSTTGTKGSLSEKQSDYFQRTKELNLKNPLVAGFGITGKETFDFACKYANGGIIGTAFVKMLNETTSMHSSIRNFVSSVR
jgi:tryptophan synthase alpha chain